MCGRGITNFENVSELSIRVSPSHSYNAVMAGLGGGGWVALMGMCMLHAVVVLCFFGIDTGLKFREVASKGPLDVLIRELCKIT